MGPRQHQPVQEDTRAPPTALYRSLRRRDSLYRRLAREAFDFLKEERLYDRALIIVNSNHGEEFYEHGGWCHSHSLYGEVINVPLIIKYPENKKRGRESERVARNIDVLPTILLDVLGIDVEIFGFDGVPLSKNPPALSSVSVNFCGGKTSPVSPSISAKRNILGIISPTRRRSRRGPMKSCSGSPATPSTKSRLQWPPRRSLGPFVSFQRRERRP